MATRVFVELVIAWLVTVTLAAAAPAPATSTNGAFYPLWRETPPNTTDMMLIYQGGRQRPAWAWNSKWTTV